RSVPVRLRGPNASGQPALLLHVVQRPHSGPGVPRPPPGLTHSSYSPWQARPRETRPARGCSVSTNIPDAFDVYTVVVLRRPADAPEMSDEDLDALQARHLAYPAEPRRQSAVVVHVR